MSKKFFSGSVRPVTGEGDGNAVDSQRGDLQSERL